MRQYLLSIAFAFLIGSSSFLWAQMDLSQPDPPAPEPRTVVAPKPALPLLTGSERWHEYMRETIGPVPIVFAAMSAGISQATDSPKEWREGSLGYAERFGNDLARNAIRQSLAQGTAALLHEDIRYYPSGGGSFWGRTEHALTSVFIAHNDRGDAIFSVPNMTGIVGASLITRAWAPPSWRTPTSVVTSIGIGMAASAGRNMLKEFVPSLFHRRSVTASADGMLQSP